ncbi:MAG TPA: hypothetical protein VMG10_13970 [Gemmataceae bacterium]|nr:hypothetical protein [Gemmataceae bacterium]
MTTDSDVFYGFVFEDQYSPPERLEEATRAVQRRLSSRALRRLNDALLERLAEAKEARQGKSKKELLDDPEISVLVNTLVLLNQAWITTNVASNSKGRPHLRGASAEELLSTALTGEGAVGGVMNAILEYDYGKYGVAAFTPYLARSIRNSLSPTPKQDRTFRRVEARTGTLRDAEEEGAGRGWVDRTAAPPEAAAINHDLLEVVQSVIPHLPSPQHRRTASWMIERILTTGELPMAREAAEIQRPRVSRERGRQIMEATVDSIREQIEAEYPQLAQQGINGWEQFKEVLTSHCEDGRRARTWSGRE